MTEWERDAWEFEQSQPWEPLDDVLHFARLDEEPPPDLPEMDSNIPF